MGPFAQDLIIVRGGGDLGTGVVYRLHRAGFPVLVLELAQPLVVRRRVALATAVLEGAITIERLHGQHINDISGVEAVLGEGAVPVLVAPDWGHVQQALPRPLFAVVDARLAKRNIDTTISQAPLVIGLGPGFTAGSDVHAVVETKRGHTLGRVIYEGAALPNTGTPGIVAGQGAERVLRAPAAGGVSWQVAIGETVTGGQILGSVAAEEVTAPFAGVVRGLIAPGTAVPAGLKIGDVDPRLDREACFTISDKALAVGGGVLEAVVAAWARRAAT